MWVRHRIPFLHKTYKGTVTKNYKITNIVTVRGYYTIVHSTPHAPGYVVHNKYSIPYVYSDTHI